MLILKRILASVIDLLLFITLTLAIDWLFIRLNIDFSNQSICYLAFITAILFPIFIFSRTIGHKTLRIIPVETRRVIIVLSHAIKYFLLFSFYSNFYNSVLSFFFNLVNDYSNFTISLWFSLRITIALLFVNVVCFLLTFGSQNLVDYLLGIRYRTRYKTGLRMKPLSIGYCFSGLMLLSTVAEHKIVTHFDFESELRRFQNNEVASYFPSEIFNNYTQGDMILSSVEGTNRIITDSDPTSFFLNKFLLQRQIIALIERSLLYDPARRHELCAQLINYAAMNEYRISDYKEIMQTKIILVNIERHTPFTNIQTSYSYYYDHKAPYHGIYGGYNVDSLSSFYTNTHENYYKQYFKKLSEAFSLPVDTLRKYQNEDGTFSFPEGYVSKVSDTAIVMNYNSQNVSLPVVKFNDVQPIQYLELSAFGSESVQITALEKGFLESKIEDMYWLKMNYIFSR